MPTIYQLKSSFQDLLRPVCRALASAGITANQVTISALILSIATGAALCFSGFAAWALFSLPVVLFVRMALNAIDGMLAREHDQKTALGAVLNELGDVVSDTVLYLPFAALPGATQPTTVLVVLFVITAIICEMAGVIGVQIGASRRYDGPMGKSDRAFVFGALGLAFALGAKPGLWFDVVIGVLLLLSMIALLNRCRHAISEVES